MTHTETWQYPEDLAVPPHFVCPDSVDEARRDGIHRDPCRSWAEKTTWEGCKTFESWENLPSRLIEATHAGFLNINFTDFQQQTLAGLWLQALNLKHMLVIGDHHPISRVFRTHVWNRQPNHPWFYTHLSYLFPYFPMVFLWFSHQHPIKTAGWTWLPRPRLPISRAMARVQPSIPA